MSIKILEAAILIDLIATHTETMHWLKEMVTWKLTNDISDLRDKSVGSFIARVEFDGCFTTAICISKLPLLV